VPPLPVPPQPVVHPDELRLGSPFALAEGKWYTIGWQRWPDDEGGPGFALLQRRRGTLRVLQRYPFTDEGWSQAWEALAARDSATVSAVSSVLAQRAADELAAAQRTAAIAALGRPGGSGGAPTAGGTTTPASATTPASPASTATSRTGAAAARERHPGRDPVNVTIVASLICGFCGTACGAAGALPAAVTFWGLAGAPYAVALLALLGYLPVAGVRALARRQNTSPPAQAGNRH
jgi:hypothetical protein